MPTTQTIRSADGTLIAYERAGAGAPLLLIPGGLIDRGKWQGVLPLLAPDWTVVAMDRRGHGQSGPYHTGHTLERDVEDALAVLDQVPNPTTLVGHSASGYIALEVALRSAHVGRVAGA